MEGTEVLSVTGNTCKRGEVYARSEVVAPVRTVTTTIKVSGGAVDRVSCKTKSPVPKDKIFDVMEEIASASCKAPVKIGDVLIADCAGTGVPVIATKAVT
jgi:CxxC motif-containing protein